MHGNNQHTPYSRELFAPDAVCQRRAPPYAHTCTNRNMYTDCYPGLRLSSFPIGAHAREPQHPDLARRAKARPKHLQGL